MVKTNYSYEKRQKELAKKKKQEEKRLRKNVSQDDRSPNEQNQPTAGEISSS